MKRLIKASTDIKLPSGWDEKDVQELKNLGYDMRDELQEEDLELCEKNEVEFLGYAINYNEDLGIVCRDENRKILVYPIKNHMKNPVSK